MTINQVTLRLATREESAYARGGTIYQSIGTPIWRYFQSGGLKELQADQSHYFLNGKPPVLLRAWNTFKRVFGYGEDSLIVTRYPCTGLDRAAIANSKAIKAVLNHPRNGEFFSGGKGMLAFAMFLQKCFPTIDINNLILFCKEDGSQAFHELLSTVLGAKCVKEYLFAIREECIASLNDIREGEVTNVTQFARQYFTKSFGQSIFHNTESSMKLNDHLSMFKEFIFKQACGQMTAEDAMNMEELAKNVRETGFEILANHHTLFLADASQAERHLSDEERAALIFTLLFAAQDNTTTVLSAAFWYLAAYPEKQEELRQVCQEYQKKPNGQYPQQLNEFFSEVIKKYPPVSGIARIANEDLCFEFTRDSETKLRKAIMFKNEIVVMRIAKAQQLGFGYGVNRCPGRNYAEASIKEAIAYALANFSMILESPQELKLKLSLTAVLENDVKVILERLPNN